MPARYNEWTAMPLLIEDLTDEQMYRYAISENVQRKDLDAIELAKAINRSDPSAGAGDQFILDPRVFSPRNFRDERARAGIG